MPFFRSNPHVAGYAPAGEYGVVLNPYSDRSPEESKWVHVNEAIRQRIREVGLPQYGEVTKQQRAMFGPNDAYSSDPAAAYETMVARAAYGDPSPGVYTPMQVAHGRMLLDGLLQKPR